MYFCFGPGVELQGWKGGLYSTVSQNHTAHVQGGVGGGGAALLIWDWNVMPIHPLIDSMPYLLIVPPPDSYEHCLCESVNAACVPARDRQCYRAPMIQISLKGTTKIPSLNNSSGGGWAFDMNYLMP